MWHDEPGPNIAACMWSEGTSAAARVQRTPKVPSPEFNFVWYPTPGRHGRVDQIPLCSKTGAEYNPSAGRWTARNVIGVPS